MAGTRESVVDRLVVQAIAGGANTLRIEYDEGYGEVSACQGDVGVSIGHRIPSSSEDAKSLRAELSALGKHPRRIEVGGRTYELRCRTYDSFGEDAFEVKFRRLLRASLGAKGDRRRTGMTSHSKNRATGRETLFPESGPIVARRPLGSIGRRSGRITPLGGSARRPARSGDLRACRRNGVGKLLPISK